MFTGLPSRMVLAVVCCMAWSAAGVFAQGADSAETSSAQSIELLQKKLVLNPADGRAWNDLGVIYAQQEDYAEARNAFIKAVQCTPTVGDYHRNLGLTFSRLDMPEMAEAEFGQYRKFDEFGGTDYWRLIGGAQVKAGRIDAARATYTEGIEAFAPDLGPDGFRLVLRLKALEAEAGHEDAVRSLFERHTPAAVRFMGRFAEQDDPSAADGYGEAQMILSGRVEFLVADGNLMVASGLNAEAAVYYKKAYALMPSRDDLLPRLVDCYLAQDLTLEAGVAARLARGAHPEQAGAWIASGKVYEATDKPVLALEAYQKAYDIEPLADLRAAIGNLYMKMGNHKEAIAWLKEGVSNGTAKPEVVYNYGVSLMREKKYHAALPSFRSVTRSMPEFQQGWLALAQCLQMTKQYRAAIEPYQKALALAPDAKLAFQVGSMAQKAKQYESAIVAYSSALTLRPVYPKAQYNLALSYMGGKQYTAAVAAFDALIEMEGPSYRAYYSQGLAHYYLEQYDAALEAYDMALEEKETANAYNNIGLVYTKLGNKKEAAKWYKIAADLKKGS